MTTRLRTSAALLLAVSALFAATADVHAAKKDIAVDCPDANRSPLRKGDIGKDLNVIGNCTVEGGDYKYGDVTIANNGTLTFNNAKIDFTAKSFIIQKGGALLAGSDTDPIGKGAIGNKVVIRLDGDRPSVPMDHSSHADDCSMVDKGIGVMDGGTLRLVGARGVPTRGGVSWTHLSKPAGPALYESDKQAEKVVKDGLLGRRIAVARDVATGPNAWQPDDWIVVATTSFSPFESEFVQIERMDPDGPTGTLITLKTALKHYHFGGPDPGPAVDPAQPYGAGTASTSFKAGKDLNYGVDERAEVGLISRNIKLTATTVDAYASPKDPGRNWGGEIKVCKGFAEATIEGVEIEKFGKEALGSYPIHFHMVGAFTGKQRVNANSVHHSYNKCVTIHSSTNLAFENNVCARITGHGFYQEIGDEVGTRIVGNLVVGVMNNNFGLPTGSNPESTTGWWEGDNLARSAGIYRARHPQPRRPAQSGPRVVLPGRCQQWLAVREAQSQAQRAAGETVRPDDRGEPRVLLRAADGLLDHQPERRAGRQLDCRVPGLGPRLLVPAAGQLPAAGRLRPTAAGDPVHLQVPAGRPFPQQSRAWLLRRDLRRAGGAGRIVRSAVPEGRRESGRLQPDRALRGLHRVAHPQPRDLDAADVVRVRERAHRDQSRGRIAGHVGRARRQRPGRMGTAEARGGRRRCRRTTSIAGGLAPTRRATRRNSPAASTATPTRRTSTSRAIRARRGTSPASTSTTARCASTTRASSASARASCCRRRS